MRPTAVEVLNHKFITKNYKKSVGVSREFFSTLINLQNFEVKCKLEEAVINFLINEFASEKEKNFVRKPFVYLDKEKKGYLT